MQQRSDGQPYLAEAKRQLRPTADPLPLSLQSETRSLDCLLLLTCCAHDDELLKLYLMSRSDPLRTPLESARTASSLSLPPPLRRPAPAGSGLAFELHTRRFQSLPPLSLVHLSASPRSRTFGPSVPPSASPLNFTAPSVSARRPIHQPYSLLRSLFRSVPVPTSGRHAPQHDPTRPPRPAPARRLHGRQEDRQGLDDQ